VQRRSLSPVLHSRQLYQGSHLFVSYTLRAVAIPFHTRSFSLYQRYNTSTSSKLSSRALAGETCSEQTTPQMSPIHSYPPMQPPYRSPREAPGKPPVSLPALRHLLWTAPTPSDPSYGKLFGVHPILNSQENIVEQQRALKRSNSQMDSPAPVDTQNSQILPSISRPNSVDSTSSRQKRQQHARPFQPPERPPVPPFYFEKRVGTHSLSSLNPPTGTIDAHQLPFLTASTRPSESMTIQPALPSPPAYGQTHHLPPKAPIPPPSMMRTEIHGPGVNFPQSGSASLIEHYSPYLQPASDPFSQYKNHSTQGQYGPMGRPVIIFNSRQGSASMESERNSMIAMAPSNQSSVQLMAIQSQDGSLHKIQVETRTASKGADEKRGRNAGASARSRAKRKEKEREASMNISRLEQSVRDSNAVAEQYRSERDRWRSIALQAHPESHITRPSSPRLRRVSGAPPRAPPSTTGHCPQACYDDH
jgi:hypothetical protein